MLISFNDIVLKYGRPCGVIHIGAHLAEEKVDYLKWGLNNTIWIEANPSVFNAMNKDLLETEKAFNFAITESDNQILKLNVTNGTQSSSLLELDTHKIQHPHIYVVETVDVNSIRMDTLIAQNNIPIEDYNFVNLDIQGVELYALKSFGNLLHKIKFIYSEVNTNTLYKNCPLIGAIDNYLMQFGFDRVETKMTDHEWGDALYLRK